MWKARFPRPFTFLLLRCFCLFPVPPSLTHTHTHNPQLLQWCVARVAVRREGERERETGLRRGDGGGVHVGACSLCALLSFLCVCGRRPLTAAALPPYCCPCFVQAAARPQVTVFSAENGEATSTVAMPAVFTAPIRMDLVHEVHVNMSKNR